MNINATLFVQMAVFFVGAWITMKFIWPPLNRAIEERQKKIADGLAAADRGEHALEEAKKEGKIRSIGVSNMTLKIWNSFVPQFDTMPSVNQVECNPLYQQKEIRKLMAEHDVRLEAWYPLGHGDKALLENPVITDLAEKYGKNPGQIILRFEN